MIAKPFFIVIVTALLSLTSAEMLGADDFSRDSATPTELTIPQPITGTDHLYRYVVDILKMALEVTAPKYGPVTIFAVGGAALQSTQLRDLEQRQLDITWSVTSLQREKRHQAVYVPLTNGLFGKRVLMVRSGEARFHEIKDEDALKEFRYIQGHDWPDAHIFRANGYRVVESSYTGAFTMLSAGFVDAFPRGVLEIHQELAEREKENFSVEPQILFEYPSALLFFVPKNRKMLAVRLEEGLKHLYGTGKLQHHLVQQPFYQTALKTMENRTVIQLSNPLLSKKTTHALETFNFSDK
ncbi:amino acid ABC transporter substrate-binding protein [Alteromonas ponticola]|uniref:Amino acid ABC transporter substrate-binding protein n=1 Tax=Alteromonas aquimaris TaxID=2998417 RepID=A0ABT3PA95_9ALTE|nr:amino acid ABC transporter substrate-binding protein [Alteromonas aquimaris]MCW8109704.1 amino acid ABC transporter substrate-binding protein [Alteromonas aquimaris]